MYWLKQHNTLLLQPLISIRLGIPSIFEPRSYWRDNSGVTDWRRRTLTFPMKVDERNILIGQ